MTMEQLDESSIAIIINDYPSSKTVEWLVTRFGRSISEGGPELRVQVLQGVLDSRTSGIDSERTILLLNSETNRLLLEAENSYLRKPTLTGDVLPFSREPPSREIKFGDLSTLLVSSERIRLAMQILSRMRVNPEDVECYRDLIRGEPLLSELTKYHIIGDILPLHDTVELYDLCKQWHAAKLSQFEPSYDAIRDYFGEKIAMYFAFLGFYTKALVLPSCLAIYNCILSFNYDAVHAQAPFAAFNLIYLTIFLKLWRRRCSSLAYRWGTYGMEKFESARPEFKGTLQLSPITRDLEITFPKRTRYRIMFCETYPVVCLCLCAALLLVWLWYVVQLWVEKRYEKYSDSWLWYIFELLMLNLPTIIYSIVIEVSNRFYKKLAYMLTTRENHRLQSEHEYHLMCKLILFQFVNCFCFLFYAAFVLQDMARLRRYLAAMLITWQLWQQALECIIPYFRVYFSKKISLSHLKKSRSGAICDILIESKMDNYEDTFDDYLEMWLQFGYAFMFSSVFPMAAFYAFANNLLEMRSDAFKLCTTMRRPFPQTAESLGIWQTAFTAIIIIAVVTNCALLGMTAGASKKFVDWPPIHIVLLFVFIEHAIILSQYAVESLVNNTPENVRIRMARADHLMNYRERMTLIDVHRRRSGFVMRSNTINEESPTLNAYRRSSRLMGESHMSPLVD